MGQRMPEFLGIGGTRCGTTWLHDALRVHPDIWLPPVKELHYFDRSARYRSPSHLSDDHLVRRLVGRASADREWRRWAGRDLGRAPRHPSTLPWKLRYYLGRPGDDWYASLFPDASAVRGEITPAYSLLDRSDVERVHRLMPQARIVFLIRNPVERVWSSYRRKGLSDDEARRRLATMDKRTDYLLTLDTWGSVFPADHIHVDFYDDIAADPAALLRRVFTFLGVDPAAGPPVAALQDRVNAAMSRPMPTEIRQGLATQHLPQLRALSDRFGGHATTWRDEALGVLRDAEATD